MGEKFPVGTENMTWTLVKYMESESSKNNASDDECLVECYSKLNVALSVMHECFEPVKEPRTRRDLMEDVIFNRWYASLVSPLLLMHYFKGSLESIAMQQLWNIFLLLHILVFLVCLIHSYIYQS